MGRSSRKCLRFVTKLDLLKGYWQVPLTDRASEISAFATTRCIYAVSCYGLWTSKCWSYFSALMSIVLSNVPNCEAYLDDVVCYR